MTRPIPEWLQRWHANLIGEYDATERQAGSMVGLLTRLYYDGMIETRDDGATLSLTAKGTASAMAAGFPDDSLALGEYLRHLYEREQERAYVRDRMVRR